MSSKLLQPGQGGIFQCPLCPWCLPVPPVTQAPGLDAVFGPGVVAAAGNMERLEKVERELHDHLSEHSIVDWITRVRELEKTRDELLRQVRLG